MEESELARRYTGKWVSDGLPENIDEYMEAAQFPWLAVKLMQRLGPYASESDIKIEGKVITIYFSTMIKAQTREFVIGNPEKVAEKNMIGREAWARFAWEDGVLVEYATLSSGKEVVLKRILEDDDNVMKVISTVVSDEGKTVESYATLTRKEEEA